MHPHDTDLTEEWRPVVGFEGYYSVSNQGRICREKPYHHTYRGRVLRAHAAGGYLKVTLSRKGIHKGAWIHTMVAAAFIGPRPQGYEINHRDGNPFNNAASNLEYVTRRQNFDHAIAHHLMPAGEHAWQRRYPERVRHGEELPWTVLTAEQVRDIRASYKPRVVSQRMLARRYGVSQGTIWCILHDRYWTHVPDEVS